VAVAAGSLPEVSVAGAVAVELFAAAVCAVGAAVICCEVPRAAAVAVVNATMPGGSGVAVGCRVPFDVGDAVGVPAVLVGVRGSPVAVGLGVRLGTGVSEGVGVAEGRGVRV
jgi:hypothetical protein